MSLEITRLHLASLAGVDGGRWPVHGFVVTHPGGAVLVDTGVGGPQQVLDDWRVVNRSVADALAELDMSPADIGLVINTHLHFDHCGQNAVFKHAPAYVQRAELSRARRESPELYEWFGFMNARFELLDGDAEVLPGLEVIATPGHTQGHQCVVVRGGEETFDLLIGDAAYTPRVYADPDQEDGGKLPAGQASDLPAWRESVRRIRSLHPERVHFCHHTDVVHGLRPTGLLLMAPLLAIWGDSDTKGPLIAMRVIAGAGTYTPPDGEDLGELNHWVVHFNSEELSLGTYSIPAGGIDDQTPHTEDEIYVVQAGRATLVTDSGVAEVGPGSVVFVPAGETHMFTEILEDLALIVVLAPPYRSRAPR